MQHLKTAAEVCPRNWYYDWQREDDEGFVEIQGYLVAPPDLARKLGYDMQKVRITMMGFLHASHLSDGFTGFSSNIETRVRVTGEGSEISSEIESGHVEEYPCTHVPVPDDFFDQELREHA